MADDVRAELSKALGRINPLDARLVADPATEITPLDASFLRRFRIYRVVHHLPHKPVGFVVGFAPGGPAYPLTAEPASFVRMAQEDGVVVDSAQTAERYATVYLEATRPSDGMFYPIRSVDEVRFRPGLSDDEQAAFTEQVREVISPPVTTPQGPDHIVTLYAVRDQAVERHDLRVSPRGDVDDKVTAVAAGLPLIYGL
jgi:hypothetical protein